MNWSSADLALKAIHEATLRPDYWPEALSLLTAACGARLCAVQMVGPNGYVGLMSHGAVDTLHEYLEGNWHLRNSRMRRGLALTRAGFKGLITEERMLTPEVRARDPFQQEFARHHGMDVSAGMVVASRPEASFVLNVERPASSGHYSDGELADMNRLMARITDVCSQALRLKLATAVQLIQSVEARGEALALVMASGRLLHATSRFEQHLQGRLTTRNGRLQAVDPHEDASLQNALKCAASGPSLADGQKTTVLNRAGVHLVVSALPIVGAGQDFLGLARMIVTVDEPYRRSAGTGPSLQEIFGLTRAEARIAGHIGNGNTLRQAASAERVAYETARTHLKSVFAKTGTDRQAQLAILINRLNTVHTDANRAHDAM